MEITIQLTDSLAKRLIAWTTMTEQEVSQIVESALDASVPHLDYEIEPVSELSDDEVLRLAHIQMSETDGERLSELQAFQREGELEESDRSELLSLMQIYNTLLVRKSEALVVAVERGLMPPLSA